MDVLVLSGAVIVPLYEPDDLIVARFGSPAVGRHRPTAKLLCRRRVFPFGFGARRAANSYNCITSAASTTISATATRRTPRCMARVRSRV